MLSTTASVHGAADHAVDGGDHRVGALPQAAREGVGSRPPHGGDGMRMAVSTGLEWLGTQSAPFSPVVSLPGWKPTTGRRLTCTSWTCRASSRWDHTSKRCTPKRARARVQQGRPRRRGVACEACWLAGRRRDTRFSGAVVEGSRALTWLFIWEHKLQHASADTWLVS